MKKAILILALSTQVAFADGEATQNGTVLKPVMMNGQLVYVQVSQDVVSRGHKPGFLKYAVKKSPSKKYEAGLRRSLLRSNFR